MLIKKIHRVLAKLAIFSLFIFGPLFYYIFYSAAEPDEKWISVKSQPVQIQLGVIGHIAAAQRQTVSAPFDGQISEIVASDGSRVEEGDLLIKFDTTSLDVDIRQALSELLKSQHALTALKNWSSSDIVSNARRAVSNAELTLADTQAQLSNAQHLFQRGIVPRMEVDALVQQIKLQKLSLSAAKAELSAALEKGSDVYLNIAQMELANAKLRYDNLQALMLSRDIYAPYAGVVLQPKFNQNSVSATVIQKGQRVTQGTPLFEIASTSYLKAVAYIEESDLQQLHQGMLVKVTGEGFSGITLDGRIGSIGAQATQSETYSGGNVYEINVKLNKLNQAQQQIIRLGMTAQLEIITYQVDSGYILPAEAVRNDENGTYVVFKKEVSDYPEKNIIKLGKSMPQGVEVFGIESGYVLIPTANVSSFD
nr:HlyD family efflux transporter periplasmic adaptor subunit [Pseudomonas luteola]